MKRKLLLLFVTVVALLSIAMVVNASADTYYETVKSDVPIWSSYSSSSTKITTISSSGYVLKVKSSVTNSSDNLWHELSSGSYNGNSLASRWVYDGNVKKHTHNCDGNGGVCKSPGCDYEYSYSISSMNALYQGDNTSGAKIWTMPYSTGKSVNVGTVSYQQVVTVTGKATNAEGNLWYRLSSGYWVYSGNLTPHSHDYSGNGGVCKLCGNTYNYSISSMSALYQGANTSGAKIWTMPYSSGQSANVGTVGYQSVVTVTGKATNAEGNLWYRLSSGYWVYSDNLTPHYHDYSSNGGVCKLCGNTYSYSITSMSALYQGAVSDGAKLWSMPYSTGKSVNVGTLGYQYVVTITGKATNADGNLWYRLNSGYWVYSENVKAHSHDCIGNGGECTYNGCTYTYPLSISSFSATYVVTNANGASIWSIPYSTGNSVKQRVAPYGEVLSVVGKASNADGNVWFKLSNGSWVWPENLTRRYTISYNANGGINPPPPQYKLQGASLTVSGKKPTRVGYIFKYWSTKSDGSGDQHAAGKGTVTKDADVTLYAIWEKCTSHDYEGGICNKCGYEYPLTVDSLNNLTYTAVNGEGTKIWDRPYSSKSTNVRTVAQGTVLTVNGKATNQPGNLWYRLTDGNWVYSENVKRSYKVDYVLNGGTNNSANPSYYYVGQDVTLKNPTRAGYTFAGWYLDSSLTQIIKKLSSSGAVTIYAKWTANTYKIVFNGNGSSSGSMSSKSATYDSAVTLTSNAFTKTGYTFGSWNTKADGSGKSYSNGASVKNLTATDGATVTLYAQWTANTYKISFNGNGATSGSMSTKSVSYGSSATLPSNSYSKTDYAFNGWNTKSDGSGTSYADGASVKNLSSSNGATITLYAQWKLKKPSFTLQPQNTTVIAGKSYSFTVAASGSGITYEWYYKSPSADSFTKSSITASTYSNTAKSTSNGTQFYCIAKDSYGQTVKSNTVTLTVPAAPSITTQPKNTTVAEGGSYTISVAASGTGLKYAWYYKSSSASSFTKSSVTASSYTNTAKSTSDGMQFYCIVTDTYGQTVKSNTVKLTISYGLAIITQPKNITVAADKSYTITVAASGTGIKYAWYYKSPSASSFTKSSITAASYTNTAKSTSNGTQFYCVVSDNSGKTVKSNTVTLTVPAAPVITAQPKNVTIAADKSYTITVAASGTGLKYAWYYKSPSASSFTKSSITAASYTNTAKSTSSGTQFYCIVTDSVGQTVKSNTVTLTVPAAPKITTQPKNTTVTADKSYTLTVAASGTGLKYSWYYKSSSASSFTKSSIAAASYTNTAKSTSNGMQFYCIVTDSVGQTAKSNTVTLTVKTPLKITSQPESVTVSSGDTFHFTVGAQGDGLTYEWYYYSASSENYVKSSVTSKTYSNTATAAKNGLKMYCRVLDKYGSVVQTKTVTLTVK